MELLHQDTRRYLEPLGHGCFQMGGGTPGLLYFRLLCELVCSDVLHMVDWGEVGWICPDDGSEKLPRVAAVAEVGLNSNILMCK